MTRTAARVLLAVLCAGTVLAGRPLARQAQTGQSQSGQSQTITIQPPADRSAQRCPVLTFVDSRWFG